MIFSPFNEKYLSHTVRSLVSYAIRRPWKKSLSSQDGLPVGWWIGSWNGFWIRRWYEEVTRSSERRCSCCCMPGGRLRCVRRMSDVGRCIVFGGSGGEVRCCTGCPSDKIDAGSSVAFGGTGVHVGTGGWGGRALLLFAAIVGGATGF